MHQDKFNYDFWQLNSAGHIDFPRMQSGGVDVQFFAVCTEYLKTSKIDYYRSAVKMINILKSTFLQNPSKIAVIMDKASLKQALRQQKKAAILAIEGGAPLQGNIHLLDKFVHLGIRVFGLTWNKKNELADGTGIKNPGGLTPFGKKVVRKLNELGVIIDCAHLAAKGLEEVACISKDPFIVSHANAYRLCPHPRNLTDEQLRILSQKKGVVGLSFYPDFIAVDKANLDKLLDHFVHIASVAGTESLGVGSDFDGIKRTLPEIPDVSFYYRLIKGLEKKGFSDKELECILGANFLRVMEQVWP